LKIDNGEKGGVTLYKRKTVINVGELAAT